MEKESVSERLKTHEAVKAIEETQAAVKAAFIAVTGYLRSTESPTAEEAHRIIDSVLDGLKCESPQGHIVAGGLSSVEPHEKGSGILKRGEQIVIDIYPRSKKTDYFADMTRTVCLGEPSERLQKMYDTVLAAQEIAISLVRPGVPCKDIQQTIENYFADAGYQTSGKGKEFSYAEGFVHSIGHGVGLEIHEPPRFGKGSGDVLIEGEVITIEPGLYYKDLGGIRIEDMVLVTADSSRNLTNCSKEFIL